MKKAVSKKSIFLIFVLIIVAGSIATAGYFYNQYQQIKNNPNLVSQEEIKSITDDISRYMDLPTGETPTLATITDVSKLKDQDFFKNAQNGDKVLIYTKAKKAILYRPSTNRVIEFAPLVLGTSEATSSASQTQPVSVAIYNGTQTVGLTTDYEKKLAGINNLSVISKTNAAKNNYTQTLVVDLSGKNQAVASQIAQAVGGEVMSQIPEGEAKPEADILIIVGK